MAGTKDLEDRPASELAQLVRGLQATVAKQRELLEQRGGGAARGSAQAAAGAQASSAGRNGQRA